MYFHEKSVDDDVERTMSAEERKRRSLVIFGCVLKTSDVVFKTRIRDEIFSREKSIWNATKHVEHVPVILKFKMKIAEYFPVGEYNSGAS